MELIEIEMSIHASVQDLGRYGYRALGVPVSGAMDRISAAYANALVGNDPREAVIEIVGGNFVFKVLRNTILAFTGAETRILVDGTPVEMWRPVWVREGSRIVVEPPRRGFVVYLAIAGGIDVEKIMGSYSTYYRAGFGGYEGRLLKPGDRIRGKPVDLEERWRTLASKTVPEHIKMRIPSSDRVVELRATRGIHADLLEQDLPKLLSSIYVVSEKSDRMGYRLEGPELEHAKSLGRLISVATDRGYVQVPPDGKPIVLMADAQTTGGYAVAIHVLPPDVDTLAQCAPGYRVKFVEVGMDEAIEIVRRYLAELENPRLVEIEEVWSEYY